MSSFRAFVLVTLLLRWCIALHPHSGYGVEPMHGDFEAQRHWVEVTSHLPRADWYRNTTDNDLQYWGLDYPPLSAYHARLIAVALRHAVGPLLLPTAQAVDALLNTSFGLHVSRGAEDMGTIVVMRAAALLTDAVAYVPPAVLLARDTIAAREGGSRSVTLDSLVALFFLLAPIPQLFVDHGHFQFNSVPAGLILWVLYLLPKAVFVAESAAPAAASSSLLHSSIFVDCAAAFLAGSAVMFKQMSLYFCPAIGVALLVRCCAPLWWPQPQQTSSSKAASTSPPPLLAVILRLVACVSCGVCGLVLPLVPLPPGDVLSRMFPFQRGLYEDKVASVWCAISPVVRLPALLGNNRDRVLLVCLASTVLGFVPAAVNFVVSATRRAPALALQEREKHDKGLIAAVQLRPGLKRQQPEKSHAPPQRMTTDAAAAAAEALDCSMALSLSRVAMLLAASSLSFFLFSFQVHEKSILMAVTATVAVWIAQDGRQPRGPLRRLACAHFMLVAMVSLQPLAVKDKLDGAPWCALTLLCAAASAAAFTSPDLARAGSAGEHAPEPSNVSAAYIVSCLALLLCAVVVPALIEPSAALPDSVPLLNAVVSCAHFVWYLVFWTRELGRLF